MRKNTFLKGELPIGYPNEQKKLYFKNSKRCVYPKWSKNVGIHRRGKNFPVMVAKKFFEDLGFSVLDEFALVRFPSKRDKDEGFKKLCSIFGKRSINKVIQEATPPNTPHPGGDPDLFVYRKRTKDSFFAEIKENDKISKNQERVFPIIEKHLCGVIIVRVKSFEKWLRIRG
jgi:hypothetical protein